MQIIAVLSCAAESAQKTDAIQMRGLLLLCLDQGLSREEVEECVQGLVDEGAVVMSARPGIGRSIHVVRNVPPRTQRLHRQLTKVLAEERHNILPGHEPPGQAVPEVAEAYGMIEGPKGVWSAGGDEPRFILAEEPLGWVLNVVTPKADPLRVGPFGWKRMGTVLMGWLRGRKAGADGDAEP